VNGSYELKPASQTSSKLSVNIALNIIMDSQKLNDRFWLAAEIKVFNAANVG